jgi:hypothetical protein
MRANKSHGLVHQDHDSLRRIKQFALEADFVMGNFSIGFKREVVDMGDTSLSNESCDLTATAIS